MDYFLWLISVFAVPVILIWGFLRVCRLLTVRYDYDRDWECLCNGGDEDAEEKD